MTQKINPKIKEKIVLAVDTDDMNIAKEMIIELKDYVGVFKLGLQFYTANGKEVFEFMKKENIPFFFDIKLMDIPNTVAKASANVVKEGASFYNVHALGGYEMMKASVEAARETALRFNQKPPIVLAVTVLSSISNDMLQKDLEINSDVSEYALKLAKLAKKAGLTGVVASVWEAKRIKEACGKDFKVLCPGIRPEWSLKDDQQRIATPKVAIQEGADYLVIGRAVTNAENRLQAMKDIYKEIEMAVTNKYLSPSKPKENIARLMLENGMVFEGESFGAKGTSFGEIVFNTSTSGYQEIITDPSYAEQVVVMTYPEIGNYGINEYDFESPNFTANGLVVKKYCEDESHYKSSKSLSEYLKENNKIGIQGIDTRYLTTLIRDNGAMNCLITTDEITDEMVSKLKNYKHNNDIYKKFSRQEKTRIEGKNKKIAVIDLGLKNSILNNIKATNSDITIFPTTVSVEEILKGNFDGLILSNGAGNPEDATEVISTVKSLLGKLPIAGVCFGYQILSLAVGAKINKLNYGHRGSNHPIINLETNKVILTTQNHNFAVDSESLPKEIIPTYKNLNDGTLEGFKSISLKIEGVQFQPEISPEANDSSLFFENWLKSLNNVLA